MIPASLLMYLVDDNNQIRLWVRLFVYFFTASFVAVALGNNAGDDGLRHIAFSANKEIMQNWGQVFPYSLFGEYDPWSFWDNFLTHIVNISSYENANIVVNLISLFILLSLIDGILNVELKRFKNTIILISLLVLIPVFGRYVNVRPDLISGFYIMSSYLFIKKHRNFKLTILLVLATVIYIPMYYLFFVYTLAISMFLFLLGDYKNMTVMGILSVFGLVFYYNYFGPESLEIVKFVLNDESLRDGMIVSEGQPLFSLFYLVDTRVLFLLYLASLLYLKFKHSDFLKRNTLLTLLITFSLLWIGQVRYFQLLQPIFYIYVISVLINLSYAKKKEIAKSILKLIVATDKTLHKNNKNISFVLVFSVFIAFELSVIVKISYAKNTEKELLAKEFSMENYNNRTVLFNNLSLPLYVALYSNPSIKTIPSCSIGWDNGEKKFHELYRKIIQKTISEKELRELAKISDSDYLFLELPINTKEKIDVKKLLNDFELVKIYDKFLIFKRI